MTPESSPEARATQDAQVHRCEACSDLTEALGKWAQGVDGLQLESKLGYYLY